MVYASLWYLLRIRIVPAFLWGSSFLISINYNFSLKLTAESQSSSHYAITTYPRFDFSGYRSVSLFKGDWLKTSIPLSIPKFGSISLSTVDRPIYAFISKFLHFTIRFLFGNFELHSTMLDICQLCSRIEHSLAKSFSSSLAYDMLVRCTWTLNFLDGIIFTSAQPRFRSISWAFPS